MPFDLSAIALFFVLALAYDVLLPPRARPWVLLIISAIAVYVLQPALPIRHSDYWFPSATLALTGVVWWFTRARGAPVLREDIIAGGVLAGTALGMTLMRFVDANYRLTASQPPPLPPVLLTLVALLAAVALGSRLTRSGDLSRPRYPAVLPAALLVLIGLFVVQKSEALASGLSGIWRVQTGQDTALASSLDIGWLGFSYIAFRLIHTIRDRQTGLLPALTLREYAAYVLFFPALVAGPIDRAERFQVDFCAIPQQKRLSAERWAQGGTRILSGVFKKFVIADTLVFGMALTPTNAAQAEHTLALWALLYGYALRLFFDFSGYTDIAIGLGILFGIRLPENFDRPYASTNITRFWQSWHMTLSAWVRAYVFSPFSRALLTRKPKPPAALVVLLAQLLTMIVIGLWHGITLNFFLWGVWHGIGLFAHKQWSDRTRRWYRTLDATPNRKRVWTAAAWLLTFHFVVLGWVWFALPDPASVLRVFGGLFGWGWTG